MTRLRVGLSTCPNDTFAFHGLLADAVDRRGLELDLWLGDVQELNERFARGELDVAKASFATALRLAADTWVLRTGSALGFGVGPLVLAGRGPRRSPPRVLCPGEGTTAHLLWRLFHPGEGAVRQVVFHEVLPALERGEADLGVCIHEGRFTYAERGLELVEDLGASWERATGGPLPLGGLLARRSLGPELVATVDALVRASLDHARAHPAAALATMRAHAQELTDEVLWAHVELYVNEHTRELGAVGRAALAALSERARAAGLLAADAPDLTPAPALPPEPPPRMFHLAPADAWASRPQGPWRPPSLAAEGFCHLSLAEQLPGTLARHFAGAGALRLVEVAPRGGGLVLEPSRDGADFPHLYRALEPDEVLREWALERGPTGWTLPDLG